MAVVCYSVLCSRKPNSRSTVQRESSCKYQVLALMLWTVTADFFFGLFYVCLFILLCFVLPTSACISSYGFVVFCWYIVPVTRRKPDSIPERSTITYKLNPNVCVETHPMSTLMVQILAKHRRHTKHI